MSVFFVGHVHFYGQSQQMFGDLGPVVAWPLTMSSAVRLQYNDAEDILLFESWQVKTNFVCLVLVLRTRARCKRAVVDCVHPQGNDSADLRVRGGARRFVLPPRVSLHPT